MSLQVNLALYCHHCEQTTVALRLMYRVRYLISLMFGHDTPEIATCDVSTTSKHLYMQITAEGIVVVVQIVQQLNKC